MEMTDHLKAITKALRGLYRRKLARDEVFSHIREKFERASSVSDPFPHLIVKDVFPRQVYSAMCADLPSTKQWTAAEKEETVKALMKAGADEKIARSNFRTMKPSAVVQPMFSLNSDPNTCSILQKYATLWNKKYHDYIALTNELTLSKFNAVISTYHAYLRDYDLLSNPPTYQGNLTIFCQRTAGWEIPPHTHDYNQIIQSMIYFPLRGSSVSQGTSLYRLNRPVFRPWSSFAATSMFAEDEVEFATRLPYDANTLVSFLNTPKSIHSSPFAQGPPRRYIFTGVSTNYNPPEGQRERVIEPSSLQF